MAHTQKIVEVDCSTGESVERDMTAEEIANLEAMIEQQQARIAEETATAEALAEAKASAIAKLAALGLTEEEAKAIAG